MLHKICIMIKENMVNSFERLVHHECFFSNIECLRVCFVPAVKSSAVVLTILCFFCIY